MSYPLNRIGMPIRHTIVRDGEPVGDCLLKSSYEMFVTRDQDLVIGEYLSNGMDVEHVLQHGIMDGQTFSNSEDYLRSLESRDINSRHLKFIDVFKRQIERVKTPLVWNHSFETEGDGIPTDWAHGGNNE